MQTANIMLALGGDASTQVPKYGVTASEIAVLRAIHGVDAVTEVEPAGDVKRNDRDEIRRLNELYGRARVTDESGSPAPVVSRLFPGAGARAIQSLDDLDPPLPDEFYKAKTRVSSKTADEPAESVDDMTKAELVDYAEANGIDIDASAKKAEILDAIKAAEADKPEQPEGNGGNDEALFG